MFSSNDKPSEMIDDLIVDLFNVLQDCKVGLSLFIDNEFVIELSYSVIRIVPESLEMREEIESECRASLFAMHAVVDGFPENFRGILRFDEEYVDKYALMYGAQIIANIFLAYGYKPSGFNNEIRWELKEAIGRVGYIHSIDTYVRTKREEHNNESDNDVVDSIDYGVDRTDNRVGIVGRIRNWFNSVTQINTAA
jgi:hypothetical protein